MKTTHQLPINLRPTWPILTNQKENLRQLKNTDYPKDSYTIANKDCIILGYLNVVDAKQQDYNFFGDWKNCKVYTFKKATQVKNALDALPDNKKKFNELKIIPMWDVAKREIKHLEWIVQKNEERKAAELISKRNWTVKEYKFYNAIAAISYNKTHGGSDYDLMKNEEFVANYIEKNPETYHEILFKFHSDWFRGMTPCTYTGQRNW